MGSEEAGGYGAVIGTKRVDLLQHASQHQYNGTDKKGRKLRI